MDTERTEETRSLVISDFRNLGISALRKSKDERTVLKINRSLKKDELGGLVIILGGNNCGKSNVLDAVAKYPKQIFDDDDQTDFIPAPKMPRLEMDIAGGKYGEIVPPKIAIGTAKCKIFGAVPDVLLYIFRQKESFDLFNEWVGKDNEFRDDIEAYLNRNEEQIRCEYSSMDREYGEALAYILRNRRGINGDSIEEIANALENGDISQYIDRELEVLVKGTPIDDVEVVGFEKRRAGDRNCSIPRYVRKDRLDEYYSNQGGIKGIAKKAAELFVRGKKPYDPIGDLKITDLSGGVKKTEVIPDAFSDVYGYNLSSNVYKYRARKISNADLTSSVDSTNEFITRLFSILGYENKSIINKYYEIPSNRDNLEEELNKELLTVSKELNRLLNAGDREYGMRIRLDKSEIRLSISCGGNKAINLDHQSEGFRWIFGFFINFLMSKKFVAGDIVIIDEFGGLLNFGTVAELTDILRDFSRKHGITFIIATQNPMAVDISHLDEVRMVVPRIDGGSDILNDFTQFGKEDCTDVLRPIVASMTVGRNYLRSENRSTVFVEGYRDYFYLSGFNALMGYDVDFVPVNGITENTSAEGLCRTLRSLERNPILIADEGIHDPASIEEMSGNGVQVYTVSEIFDGGKRSVTDLFSEDDRERLSAEDASFDHAACLSHSIPSDKKMTEETKNNFRRILDYISLG